MSDEAVGISKPATKRAPSSPAATGSDVFKKTLTLSFGPKDKDVYARLVADADNDDRDLADFIVRWLRSFYPKPATSEKE